MELTRREILAAHKRAALPSLTSDATATIRLTTIRERFVAAQADLSALDSTMHNAPKRVREALDDLIASMATLAEAVQEKRS